MKSGTRFSMPRATACSPGASRRRLSCGSSEIGAAVVLGLAPLTLVLVKAPAFVGLQIALAMLLMVSRVAMHLLTLPVEFDASFRRALPIIEGGRFLRGEDVESARAVLRAAAFTYVASALGTVLNVLRWFRF